MAWDPVWEEDTDHKDYLDKGYSTPHRVLEAWGALLQEVLPSLTPSKLTSRYVALHPPTLSYTSQYGYYKLRFTSDIMYFITSRTDSV
jgi:hypothetical protein